MVKRARSHGPGSRKPQRRRTRAPGKPAPHSRQDWSGAIFHHLAEHGPLEETGLVRQFAGEKAGKERTRDFLRQFHALRRGGWIQESGDGRLNVQAMEGVLRVHPKGYGFVLSGDPAVKDVFVPERDMLGAHHEDRVLAWVRGVVDGPGPEGRVVAILERTRQEVVGKLRWQSGEWVVIPADMRQPLVRVEAPGPEFHASDIVIVDITGWPKPGSNLAKGVLRERVGGDSDPGIDVRTIMVERHLPSGFPDSVKEAAAKLPETVPTQDLAGRLDLRSDWVVTIDGADAKDLDDAISIERTAKGYRLGVHIADVGHYVPEGSPLDLEARSRGTSVYLVDRVLPMFPPALSNGLASLHPNVDRLTLSVFIDLDRKGRVLATECARSVIRSQCRFTYEEVNHRLATSGGEHLAWLRLARELMGHLRANRVKRGALDFDLPEARVVLDAAGRPIEVGVRERGDAQRIIEECMILANEAVATLLLEKDLPGIFRVHAPPDPEKMQQFRELAGVFGIRVPKTVTPTALQGILTDTVGRPEEAVVQRVLLRSMQQAKYSAINSGHFGLASERYLHFTSPIRRYPDLFVHRTLSEWLQGTLSPERIETLRDLSAEVATVASAREREAMEAERDSVEAKQAWYMAEHQGETFQGLVSGVTGFGLFVELPTMVEGLVPLEHLPQDHWLHDPAHFTLTGARGGMSYRLGDPMTVVVDRVDVPLRRITFRLADAEREGSARHRVGGPARARRPNSRRPRRKASAGGAARG